MSPGRLGVVAPFWLDRPDLEVLDIAARAPEYGFERMWIGEMATFDAFALATAVGLRAPGLRLTVGPLAVSVRTPVGIALGVSSVATLTGVKVDVALGASSPDIVTGWHGRPYERAAPRMRQSVEVLRALFAGDRAAADGPDVRTRGFRLRSPQPGTTLTVAAYGPHMTRVAAEQADQIVLNLVTPQRVAQARTAIDAAAQQAGRPRPALAVWVPAALDPGPETLRQLAGQLAVYLRPPGYGEMFAELGFGELVERARGGESRATLVDAVPLELLQAVGAVGAGGEVAGAVEGYLEAGADHVGIVPATAEDAAGARTLALLGGRAAPEPGGRP